MSLRVVTSLNAAAATGAGTEFTLKRPGNVTMQVTGTFVATIEFQGSVDGTNFETIGAAVTIPDIVANPAGEQYAVVRANVTAYTSGTINATIAIPG